ncbi:MAG TPA: hypothetical protein DCE41_12400 [Cytophagales bacterium]|nr:hypothetical protein [Cytophagales bacterium]
MLLFLTCSIIPSFGQSPYLSVEEITRGERFTFPLITSDNDLVDYKINTYLQLAELELLKGHEHDHIFERVALDDGTIYGGAAAIDYEILQNTHRAFSVKLDRSSCGATCAYWNKYYNFNPQNGDRYFLQDFFGEAEFEVFKKLVTDRRKATLTDDLERIELTEEVAEFVKGYVGSAIEEDDLEGFYFTKDSIYLDIFHLLGKHEKSAGLTLLTAVAISDIAPLLNAFGESALISGRHLGSYEAQQGPQLYFGTIHDQYDFVMLIRQDGETHHHGLYAYLKYGVGIYLDGKLQGDEYHFEEKNSQLEVTGNLSFQERGGVLTGTWTDPEATTTLTLHARR